MDFSAYFSGLAMVLVWSFGGCDDVRRVERLSSVECDSLVFEHVKEDRVLGFDMYWLNVYDSDGNLKVRANLGSHGWDGLEYFLENPSSREDYLKQD
jgi:hypothetical protein